MKQYMEIIRQLSMLSQLGLSFVTPLLLCMGLCWLLQAKAGAGAWVYIPGIILGLGSSFTVAWKFYAAVTKREEKRAGKKKISFNRHE